MRTYSPFYVMLKSKMTFLIILLALTFNAYSTNLVSTGDTWKYNDSGSNLGTSWTGTGYNDSGWSSGASDLGFGNSNNTTINNHGGITYYFRKTINIADASAFADYTFELMRDDGAVIYVNGTEVYRDNMPSGTINYTTTADAVVGGSDETTYFVNTSTAPFVTGNNVIAVEVHQINSSSSDITFDLEITGNAAPAATYINYGSSWKYLDDGSNQGTAWQASAFNDSGWSSGNAELGYGDGDENTTVGYVGGSSNKNATTYFRKSFSATGFAGTDYFRIYLVRDDGAVVYLNGTEIWRNNMPSGTISYNTFANAVVSGSDESTAQTLLVPASTFINGTNVIAVEIHQENASSSDISMNMQIENIGSPTVDLERGPYLQTLTQNSVIVKWRTNIPVNSVVNYGLSSGTLNSTSTNPTVTTEHEVTISGLTEDTKYFYDFGYTGTVIAGGDANHFVVTAPATNSTDLMRAWVLGDAGTANGDQRAVRDAYYNYVGADHTDMILMLGDNAYNDGTDAQYQNAMFENMYEDKLKNAVTWSCPGNHDIYSANSSTQTGPYYDIFTFPKAGEAGGLASGTEAYYSWDYGQTHFISMDSDDSPRNTGGTMLTWLTNDLAATTKKWVVVIFHHPPYTKGSHDSDNTGDSGGRMRDMRENVLPILENYGVDLVLSGHSHTYERSYLLKGHHDVSSTFNSSMQVDAGSGKADVDCSYQKTTSGANAGDGSVYITAGSSGKVTGTLTHHPAIYAYLYQLGSVVVEIEENRMDVKFINDSGNITDYFSIDKDIRTAAVDTTITSGSSIDLIASWMDDFSWSPGSATTKSITVSPVVNTQYIVENANGCLADTFNITVVSGNNPPDIIADFASTINEPITIDVLGNDTDMDGDDISILAITSAPNQGGTATVNNNGTPGNPYDDYIDYTPSGIYFGVEVFEYSACDDYLPAKCDNALVSVTITENVAPVANNDSETTTTTSSVTIDVLSNDSDANGQNVTITSIIVGPSQGSNASINNNGTPSDPTDDFIDYIPTQTFVGTESFSYQICDNGNPNLCATAVVDVDVTTCVDGSTTASSAAFSYGSQWKYHDVGTNLGTIWRSSLYVDDCWNYGNGKLGFGDATSTVLNDVNQVTFYFRKHFNIVDKSTIQELAIDMVRDDGAIVYINGIEVYRTNMPVGAVTSATLASTNVSGSEETDEHSFVIPAASLVNGNNVIAVEVHQDNPSSSDISFDMTSTIVPINNYTWIYESISGNIFLDTDFNRSLSAGDAGSGALLVEAFQDKNGNGSLDDSDPLVGTDLTSLDGSYQLDVYPADIQSIHSAPQANSDDAIEDVSTGNVSLSGIQFESADVSGAEIELFDSLSTWKYYDSGFPSGNWKDNGYNDGSWSSGQAHLGFSGERTFNTTLSSGETAYYFRKEINIASVDAPNYGIALAQVRFDDGVIIYINGNEVSRRNMPEGYISHSTGSVDRINAFDELVYTDLHLSNPGFVTGTNTIAVEVHQFNSGSSDVVFDLRLATYLIDVDEVGLRFPNIAIPQGANIIDANLTFASASASSSIISVKIEGENIDNAPTFSSANSNISNRSRTSQKEWSSKFPILATDRVNLLDLGSIIQEIVNRPGWTSGNALALFLSGFTNQFYSKEGNAAPELVISYVDTSQTIISYIININDNSLPSEHIYMTDKNPVVSISEGARAETNINIGYLGTTSVCVASSDDNYDGLHIINRFNGANKLIGEFGGSTDIEAIALSQNSDSLFAIDGDAFGLIDFSTGAFTPYGNTIGSGDGSLGSYTFDDIDGLAYDIENNILWATQRRGGGNDLLFVIDHTTGTFIPDVFGAGIDYVVSSGAGLLEDIDDIAVSPSTGNLFAMNNNGGLLTNLIEINVATGAATVVNSTGVNDMEGQGFHSDGKFYSTSGRIGMPSNVFFEVDTTNASLTPIGYFSSGGDFEGCDCNSGPYLSVLEGTVFADADANGIFDGADVVESNVTVYLLEDIDLNNLISITDLVIDSMVTDSDGQFFFAVNRKGTFLVTPKVTDLPGGAIFTTPDLRNARFTATGNFDPDNDFGYRQNLLPVELTSFFGKHEDEENHLFWITASEINNSHFNILRSDNAINFETIGTVEGEGTTNKTNYYSFVDQDPLEGENYYQLEQVDFDQAKDYSKIILLNSLNGSVAKLNLWPNPTRNELNLSGLYQFEGYEIRLSISDIFGKTQLERTFKITSDNIEILLDNFNPGYYIVDILFEGQHHAISFVKQ